MGLFYILILVMPLSEHHIWSEFVGDFTGIKYVGLACMVYAVFYLVTSKRIPAYFATWQARLFMVLFLLATLSYVALPSQLVWYQAHWTTYLSLLMLFFITLAVVDSQSRLRWTLLTTTASLGLASLYALRDWQVNHVIYPGYRPAGVVGDANYFSVDILLFLPVTLLMAQRSTATWQRIFCFGCFIVTLFALILSASRGAFMGLILSSLYLILRSRNRIRNFSIIGASLLIVILLSPNSPIERITNPTGGDEISADTHFALIHGGLRLILSHPIFGVGLDNFMSRIPDYVTPEEASHMDRVARVAHNSYIEIGAEVGMPALLAFLGILVCSFMSLERVAQSARRSRATYLREMALGLQTGLIGASVAIFFISAEYEKMLWMSIFLCMCLPPLALQAKRRYERAKAEAAELEHMQPPDHSGVLEPAPTW